VPGSGTPEAGGARSRIERENRRADLREGQTLQVVIAAIAGLATLLSLVAGLVAARDAGGSREPDSSVLEGVEMYNIHDGDAPEFVKTDDQVLAFTPPSSPPWWELFVPFFGTLIAAIVAAGALVVSTVFTGRRNEALAQRVRALEDRAGSTAPA
jgi:hypothetical protein